MAGAGKKSFEFRMSKKVAELTQVVHMLFTRNHEKEVELEALRDAYEYEIELVMKDAKQTIENLEKQCRELLKDKNNDDSKYKQILADELEKQDNEWKAKVVSAENALAAEKKECQNLRDLLINAQNDIEKLRQFQSSDVDKLKGSVSSKDKEIASLRSYTKTLEDSIKEKNSQLDLLLEIQKQNEKYKKEIEKLRENAALSEKMKEQLIAKNKQLELDIKNLRRELSKRLSSASKASTDTRESIPSANFVDYDDEMDRLKREVQRYRMELSNRENNFNRMFTTQHVEQRVTSKAKPTMRYTREKTFAGRTSLDTSGEENGLFVSKDISPRGSATPSPNHRLPALSMDPRSRLNRLIKPKPLPREVLSGKQT